MRGDEYGYSPVGKIVDGIPERPSADRIDTAGRLIENGENMGFARANNLALEQVTGRCVLLLNPDTVLRKDTIPAMLDFFEKKVGLGSDFASGETYIVNVNDETSSFVMQ